MSTRPGTLKRLWWRWKSLRLPWRKKWLVGFDLTGNTFWEFKDALNANRLRRIVHYNTQVHFADVNVSPSWLQWLRHTRYDAPTITEQRLDVQRQARIKQLAAQADARWTAQASYLQAPEPPPSSPTPESSATENPTQELMAVMEDLVAKSENSVQQASEEIPNAPKPQRAKRKVQWEDLRLGKSDSEQQPESWVPRPAKRR